MTAIDTNILIYACDKGSGAKQARSLEIIAGTVDGVLLWQVACEFVSASRKLSSQGFSPVEAWVRLSEFLALFPLATPTSGVLSRAKDLQLAHKVAFWDAMILGSCLESGIQRLYSEDIPGVVVEGLEVVNPFA